MNPIASRPDKIHRKPAARRRRVWTVLLAVSLAATTLGLSLGSAGTAFQLGRQGRLQVRQMEIGYRLGDVSLKVRAHTITGLAIEYRTSEPAEIDRIMKFSELLAGGRAQIFIEIEKDTILTFDATVP
jgi:hypothetical protein